MLQPPPIIRVDRVPRAAAGDIEIHAIETLDVSISGLGSVGYSGDPKLTKSVSGLETVRKKS